MESRKTGLTNASAGERQRRRRRGGTCGHSEGGRD